LTETTGVFTLTVINIFYTIIIFPITQILEFSFFLSQKLFKDSGISVIFISLVISTLLLPLYALAEKWQQVERNTAKKLKPKTDKIKKVFKGDEQYMILSAYYRQNHYHPIYTLRNSFGLLIQIPFFIAAYLYLSHLEIIKNVPFLFIKDLGSPDALLKIGGFTVNLLPFVMTFINCLSGAIYTKGFLIKDKIQLFGMAGVFLILLYTSPSALVLYWTMNNVFSLAKNIYYRIQFKFKRYLLLSLFSAACIFLAVFSMLKYGYVTKTWKLAFVCFFAAFVPWIFVVFQRQIFKIVNIKYEPVSSLMIFLASIFVTWVLFGLFIPSQLLVSSPQEFSFVDEYNSPLFFIFNTAIQVFAFFVFWPVCLYFLFPDNVKKYFSFFFLAVSICSIINMFLFSGNYGLISINFVYDSNPSHSAGEILFNLFILLIPFAAALILYMRKNKNIILIPVYLCVFSLLTISVINILKINNSFKELKTYYVKEQKDTQEIKPIFSLSKTGKNIVVIMLDRAVSVFMPFIFDESPELKEIYSGFTFYPNTVSFNGYTYIGSPPVYGGYEYTPEEINKRNNIPLVEKLNQSLLMLPRIFSENGFSVFVTDPPYANSNWKSDLSIFNNYHEIKAYFTDSQYTDFWLAEHNIKLPQTGDIIKRNMFWYSLLKGLPLLFRQPVYMDGRWCSPESGQPLRLTLNGYAVLDYLPRFTEITDNDLNTALLITNNTTHENSFLQAPQYTPVITVTNYGNSRFAKEYAYHINAAAIKRLADWFDFLKKENVYDNTRIILVSDHGPEPNFITKIGLPFNVDQFNPLLMVKDFDASGEIKTDFTFMSNADVPYLSLKNVIENPVNPFTGNEISVDRKKEPLYIAVSGAIHITDKNDTQFTLNPKFDYYVHDNIFAAQNWIPVLKEK
jgi:YidC/Oxa1 family membrane protein insertase